MTDNEAMAALPFGKVVSAIAHGIDPATLIAAPPADDGAGEATGDETTDGTVSETEAGDGSTTETGAGATDEGLDVAALTDELIDAVADVSSAESGLVELLEEQQEDEA